MAGQNTQTRVDAPTATLPVDPDLATQNSLALAIDQARTRQMTLGALIEHANRFAAAPASAAALYSTWIACNSDSPGLHAVTFNHAVCLADAGDLAGAAIALRNAIHLKPDFAPPYINLGGVLERLGQPGQAVETWLSYVNTLQAITPDALAHKLIALKQVGRVLEGANRDEAAEDVLRQSLELDPTQHDAVQHFIALRQRQCEWPALPQVGAVSPATLRASISPLSAAYYADDPIFHLATAYHYARRTIGVPPPVARPSSLEAVPKATPTRRIRVGYLSSDLRDHAVGFAMTDVIELHDRTQIETSVYYCGVSTTDATQQRTRLAADRWTDLNGLDDAQAAQTIRQDGIDILVDLNGYTKDARTKVLAMRPAPVLVNWFGFPGSMGTPYHHYIIADDHIIPPGDETFYSETVLRLPCYQPNDRKRTVTSPAPSRQQAGLPDGRFVFCCLNGMQKLTPPMFECWMKILRQVPDSVLWLLTGTPETNDRLKTMAQTHAIDPQRLIFAPKMRNPDHLARMALADLFLDTFPYGAHTTASDAMWVGLPVLTLRGRSFASRVCSSLVAAAGTPETICHTPQDYASRAVALAHEPAQLASLRASLAATRDTCTLFDTPRLVRSLEALYHQMHAARLAGTLPQPDLANLDIYHEIGADMDLDAMDPLPTTAYLARYQDKLAELNGAYPIRPDHRLWME